MSREYRESLGSAAPVRQCEAVRNLPLHAQANARVALLLVGTTVKASTVALAPEERTYIAASKAAAARGEFASDGQGRAAWLGTFYNSL
jgi:hypothetical protein